MNTPTIFARITKIDEARREVWGRAAEEVVDKVDELFDYTKSKPYFEAWSKEFSDATDGKSLGNIRAMHGKVAAGKAIKVDFSDSAKAIDIGTKIVDDQEWAKCLEGVYTGFSIGGSYVGDKTTEKIDGRDVRRYVAKPTEISLVDNPCIPTAKFFDVIKADGVIAKVAFKEAPVEVTGSDEEVRAFGKALNDARMTLADAIALVVEKQQVDAMLETSADLKKRDFSTEERDKAAESGAALPDGSFPIKTVGDLKNAIKAYGRAKDKAKAKAHIISRAKALGATSELPEDWGKAAVGELEKDFAEAVAFVELKARLADPNLPFADFIKIAQERLTPEEFGAIKSGDTAKIKELIMSKAKLTAAHKDRVQAIHDHAASMGADCDSDTDKKAKGGDLNKGVDLAKQLETALDRIAKLEKQPAPHAVTLRVVSKGGDSEQATKDALQAMPYDQLVKLPDGTVDWKASEAKLNKTGAAA